MYFEVPLLDMWQPVFEAVDASNWSLNDAPSPKHCSCVEDGYQQVQRSEQWHDPGVFGIIYGLGSDISLWSIEDMLFGDFLLN